MRSPPARRARCLTKHRRLRRRQVNRSLHAQAQIAKCTLINNGMGKYGDQSLRPTSRAKGPRNAKPNLNALPENFGALVVILQALSVDFFQALQVAVSCATA